MPEDLIIPNVRPLYICPDVRFPVQVDLFDFELPPHNIAQTPASPRDSAKMLVVQDDVVLDQGVASLADFLKPGDICVFNDTRVIPARLTGKRGEAGMEVTLHKQQAPDTWLAFARPAKKLKIDDVIDFDDGFHATVLAKGLGGEVTLGFSVSGSDLMKALQAQGAMPLPPYIKRAKGGKAEDVDDYQTLFAKRLGAVAAPTAGLHFTPALVQSLEDRNIKIARVTLHVGAGTFLPVKVDDTKNHIMHAENGEINEATAAAINDVKNNGGRVIAIGTTSLRILETATDDNGRVQAYRGDTSIFITPGYSFKVVDVMMTNFHLPRSTLFMLVSAFAGLKRMHQAYRHAIKSGYRFYSYGDTCLLHQTKDQS